MDIPNVMKRVGVTSIAVSTKAGELLRLSKIKMPGTHRAMSSWSRREACRVARFGAKSIVHMFESCTSRFRTILLHYTFFCHTFYRPHCQLLRGVSALQRKRAAFPAAALPTLFTSPPLRRRRPGRWRGRARARMRAAGLLAAARRPRAAAERIRASGLLHAQNLPAGASALPKLHANGL